MIRVNFSLVKKTDKKTLWGRGAHKLYQQLTVFFSTSNTACRKEPQTGAIFCNTPLPHVKSKVFFSSFPSKNRSHQKAIKTPIGFHHSSNPTTYCKKFRAETQTLNPETEKPTPMIFPQNNVPKKPKELQLFFITITKWTLVILRRVRTRFLEAELGVKVFI